MANVKTADCFQALSDPSRREILLMLSKEKQNINAIADSFDISRPAVSKHIKVLYDAGFITITAQGRERYCELNQQGFDELKEWISFFEAYWTKRLKQLDTFLKTKHAKPKK
ncbi:winged helix-turn-helix transcriptional regulator [Chitinophaga agrisoli]|uniref:Winged helix-turn-helix transcriptional regulator n=1 Tax=Chitinophaga agrisoli TaxID=2607653 RepID=A0A5B2VLH6_9BACT|nr:metalloregulator ArsR/SmtB family transcription factor [Chitinophaga agrisoli]KAA2239931.1 winged helix-turn-helix transcriptional regulator [Chitinophaga agrisoli]